MDKDTSEVLFTNDAAFCFIGEINSSDKTNSSGYTGDGDKNTRIRLEQQNGHGSWIHQERKKFYSCKMMKSKEGTCAAVNV